MFPCSFKIIMVCLYLIHEIQMNDLAAAIKPSRTTFVAGVYLVQYLVVSILQFTGGTSLGGNKLCFNRKRQFLLTVLSCYGHESSSNVPMSMWINQQQTHNKVKKPCLLIHVLNCFVHQVTNNQKFFPPLTDHFSIVTHFPCRIDLIIAHCLHM